MKSLFSTARRLLSGGKAVVFGLPFGAEDLGPINLFDKWFKEAQKSDLLLPEAMTLATADEEGRPSARMVLLKGYDDEGFSFYTNLSSRKASEIEKNAHAALVFYWGPLQRQIRVEGAVERLGAEEDRAYFASRPRGSQLGAWASKQSQILTDRRILQDAFNRYSKKFTGVDVPLPEFWGGFRVVPSCIEFWQGRANRLHDRLLFVRHGSGWSSSRLYP